MQCTPVVQVTSTAEGMCEPRCRRTGREPWDGLGKGWAWEERLGAAGHGGCLGVPTKAAWAAFPLMVLRRGSSDGDRPGGLCHPDPMCTLAWILWKAIPGFPAHLLLRCAEDPSWTHADLGLNLDLCLLTL